MYVGGIIIAFQYGFENWNQIWVNSYIIRIKTYITIVKVARVLSNCLVFAFSNPISCISRNEDSVYAFFT
jgi:hypothetical protein